MAIAYNLGRLVYLSLDQQVEIDFTEGAKLLGRTPWTSLQHLHDTMTVKKSTTRRLANRVS